MPTFQEATETPTLRQAQTRVSAVASLEIRDFDEPVSGMIVSLPGGGQPSLNRLYIREGGMPGNGTTGVLLNETFAGAHDLRPGDHLTAIISGRRQVLTVSGIALSPEFLMQIQPGRGSAERLEGLTVMAAMSMMAASSMSPASTT